MQTKIYRSSDENDEELEDLEEFKAKKYGGSSKSRRVIADDGEGK